MKNALFAGIATKKEDDDSDEDKKKEETKQEPMIDLLNMDDGPA